MTKCNNWCTSSLGNLVSFQKGRKVDTSDHLQPGYQRYLGASGLAGKFDGYASTFMAVTADEYDLLMLWDGERAGLVGHKQVGVVASTVTKLTPNRQIDSEFLFYALLHNFRWIQYQRTGTGVPHVPKDIGRILSVRYPKDQLKQKKIATILSTIDTAIEKTEALIGKYQQIKAGLMHDLFTRGVLPSGQLRPTREQAPELYQETAIGWIPREWGQPAPLESLLAGVSNNMRSGPFGSALLKHELVEEGIPFLGIDNIHVERFDKNFRRFVSDKKFRELFKYSVRPKDVVITIMGTVGRCCVIPEDLEKALSSKHLWTMTFDPEKVVPELICWQLNYASWVKTWFRRETQGGIMDAIQSKTLRALKLPVPPIEEQKLIFDRYNRTSDIISSESERLNKLKLEKLGLMQDLLTGKVPVTINEPEAVHG